MAPQKVMIAQVPSARTSGRIVIVVIVGLAEGIDAALGILGGTRLGWVERYKGTKGLMGWSFNAEDILEFSSNGK
jgi:hypothetical protein